MRRLCLVSLLLCAACGGEVIVDPPPPPAGDVQLGTSTQMGSSDLPFLPVDSGADLELEPGAQGGFHVFVHLRVPADSIAAMGDRPLVQRWARRVDTDELVSRAKRTHVFVDSDEAGIVQLEAPVLLFLCPTPIGIEVADQMLNLEVEISADEDTPGVKGSLQFTPRCPEGDQNEFCNNICFG